MQKSSEKQIEDAVSHILLTLLILLMIFLPFPLTWLLLLILLCINFVSDLLHLINFITTGAQRVTNTPSFR
jgi:hypothetical protein